MTKIKICGMMSCEDIESVNLAMPDYIGFIFAENRKRTVSVSQAKEMKSKLDRRIKAVGVFVNQPIEWIEKLAKEEMIDLIQLHGDEDRFYIETLRQKIHLPVIKAVRVRSTEEIYQAEKLPVDYLLLDTYKKDTYGGTGESFDWSRIPELKKPYFLAGGIDFQNIHEALQQAAYCVDISSGVETDGKKDRQKILEIVRIIRSE